MYVVREIMHCKPGKVGEMVKRFKQMEPIMKELGQTGPARVMTDMSGEQFWTIVWEQETANLEQYVEMARQSMSDPRLQKIMTGYHDFVVSGKREIYKVE
jgi:hypothetical protein